MNEETGEINDWATQYKCLACSKVWEVPSPARKNDACPACHNKAPQVWFVFDKNKDKERFAHEQSSAQVQPQASELKVEPEVAEEMGKTLEEALDTLHEPLCGQQPALVIMERSTDGESWEDIEVGNTGWNVAIKRQRNDKQ